ncbi:MAG: M12 family metallopeptidase [Sinimarinibacterium sp.]|jgi:hypothetical protein
MALLSLATTARADAQSLLRDLGVQGVLDRDAGYAPLDAEAQRRLFNGGAEFALGELPRPQQWEEGATGEVIDVDGRLGLRGQAVTYRVVAGKPRFEGDMTLPMDMFQPRVDLQGLTGFRAMQMKPFAFVELDVRVWPSRTIWYCIDNSLGGERYKAILGAVEHWNSHLPSIVVAWRQARGDTTNQYYCDDTRWRSRVRFTAIGGDTCFSPAGRANSLREQEIELAPTCIERDILHEMGHAAGLLHEHSRNDRDEWITIVDKNIRADAKDAFEQPKRPAVALTKYDYVSVMHYRADAYSSNENPTIEAKQPTDQIGGEVLSERDVRGLADLYTSFSNHSGPGVILDQ